MHSDIQRANPDLFVYTREGTEQANQGVCWGGSPYDPIHQISEETSHQSTQNQRSFTWVNSARGTRPRENLGSCNEQYQSKSEKFFSPFPNFCHPYFEELFLLECNWRNIIMFCSILFVSSGELYYKQFICCYYWYFILTCSEILEL